MTKRGTKTKREVRGGIYESMRDYNVGNWSAMNTEDFGSCGSEDETKYRSNAVKMEYEGKTTSSL